MKKTTIQILLVLGTSLIVVQQAPAQGPDELLQVAVEVNQELQTLKKEYLAALEKAPQLSQLPNPEIGVGAFILPVETRLGPQRGRISVTQMFPWFGTLQVQEDWAIAQAKATFERIAATELELRYRISLAYFSLYELQASQLTIQRNIAMFNSLKELAVAKVSSGKATLADVLRLDLKINELNQRLQLLENRKRKPLADINQILHRNLDSPILVPDSLFMAELTISQDSLLAEIRAAHPMVRMYHLQQEASRVAIRANELQGKPSFGIGLDYINTGQRTDAFPTNNGRDAFQVRATISVPIYRQKYRAREREEMFRIEAIEARKMETISLFEAMIEKAYADYEDSQLNLKLFDQQIETTKAAIQILEADYAAQARSFDELLQLEVSLLDYELRQLQAVARSHMAKAGIERYLPY